MRSTPVIFLPLDAGAGDVSGPGILRGIETMSAVGYSVTTEGAVAAATAFKEFLLDPDKGVIAY